MPSGQAVFLAALLALTSSYVACFIGSNRSVWLRCTGVLNLTRSSTSLHRTVDGHRWRSSLSPSPGSSHSSPPIESAKPGSRHIAKGIPSPPSYRRPFGRTMSSTKIFWMRGSNSVSLELWRASTVSALSANARPISRYPFVSAHSITVNSGRLRRPPSSVHSSSPPLQSSRSWETAVRASLHSRFNSRTGH